MPLVSSVVTVTLNPEATLKALGDEEALKAAKAIAPKTYVAYVTKVCITFSWSFFLTPCINYDGY